MNASWKGRHSGADCVAGSPVAPVLRRVRDRGFVLPNYNH